MVDVVESYRIKNLTVSNVAIDNVTLKKYESVGIVFLTDGVREAQAEGLISVTQTLSNAELITNLENFISELRSDNGVYPVGTVTQG